MTSNRISDELMQPENIANLADYVAELEEKAAETDRLKEKIAKLKERLSRDGGTGAYNKEQFRENLERVIARNEKARDGQETPVCVAIADADYFKRVNDTYGHLAGDLVLKELALVLRIGARIFDIVHRIGGEELAVIAQTDRQGGMALAERLRGIVENHEFTYQGKRIPITISLGVSEYKPGMTADELCDKADKALYRAKETGRNRVCVAE